MHRSTRSTLRKYHEMGLLKDRPPDRVVRDKKFDYEDQAERAVYDSVSKYIERRFTELEQEKPGKGFVMTVYRRRASSSPRALERSLGRRRDALLQVTKQHAFDPWLGSADVPELLDPDEMPEGEGTIKVSASLPQSPAVARSELQDVDRLLDQLAALGQKDSKRDVFFRELRRITDDGRSVLVFTEYTDTMEYLRDSLKPFYNSTVACYSGDGGQIWEGDEWKTVTKADITAALKNRTIQVLLCTDAASEGLNLQAAGALVNYDLPWNPSKVEQRIGRIDRIGQKSEQVLVVNLFLEHSVDERVYQALRDRCGLFEHFVGAMQPVLALARRMLRGEQPVDPNALEAVASQVEQDPLAAETYMESEAATGDCSPASYTQAELCRALDMLSSDIGFTVKKEKQLDACSVSGHGFPKTRFGLCIDALEKDSALHAKLLLRNKGPRGLSWPRLRSEAGWALMPPLFAALTKSIVLLTEAVMDAPRGREARREERHPITCAVQISWQRANGESCTTRATCREVSLHGARVECSEPLIARSSVYLSAPSYGLMGNATVRYCRRKDMTFAIGLEFTWAAALAEEGRKLIIREPQ